MRLQISRAVLILSLLTVPLLGCSRSDSSVAPAVVPLAVSVQTDPAVPHAEQQTSFLVEVTERDKPVVQAEVSLYLEMREMDHGEHVIRLVETSPGQYRGAGTFPMSGTWVTHVRVKREQGTESVNGEVTVSD
ncbi:FixH family protein [Tumebacillus algifaecis]|nr:FixH family protein [Tumebacillus algifaecis]